MIFNLKIANLEGAKAQINNLALRCLIKNGNLIFSLIATFLITEQDILNNRGSIFSMLSLFCLLFFFVGIFFIFSEKKQALHDIIAKTAVYKKEDVSEGVQSENN